MNTLFGQTDSVQIYVKDLNLSLDFKPVTRFMVVIPDYYVSIYGHIYSHKSKKILKPSYQYHNTVSKKRLKCLYVKVYIDLNLLSHEYVYSNTSKNKAKVHLDIHRAVIEAWNPLDKNPPVSYKEWKVTPESVKEIVRSSMIVDHIDADPTNNHVSNLRWVVCKENSPYRKGDIKNEIS